MKKTIQLSFVLFSLMAFQLQAQSSSKLIGRWDLKVQNNGQQLPSWLEVEFSGAKTLVGRFVSESGSARPIAEVLETENKFNFSIPPQWSGHQYLHLSGTRDGDNLAGYMITNSGETATFTGVRAPALEREAPVEWTQAVAIFNGKDLSGWRSLDSSRENQWEVENGLLSNPISGVNLATVENYDDFKLHIEFKYPANSNSGVYLRGRYEVQVADDFGKEPNSHYIGGIYGFLTPNQNAAKPAGQWQTYDISLVGRRVTVVLNGKSIITDATIPGITGGALDANEAAPGPIYLQGDHGAVQYRNITISVPKR